MATMTGRDLGKVMRWLKANCVDHSPHEIVDGSVRVERGMIKYDTVGRVGGLHRIPHTVPQTVTYQQANASA